MTIEENVNKEGEKLNDLSILFIDDEPCIADLIEAFLPNNYAMDKAYSAEDAIKIRGKTYDMAVVDGLEGKWLNVVDYLSNNKMAKKILLFTSNSDYIDAATKKGISCFEKPGERDKLIAFLKERKSNQ